MAQTAFGQNWCSWCFGHVCVFQDFGCVQDCVCVCVRRGFTEQPENSKRAHLSAPALQTPPKFHEKTPREIQKERKQGREREQKARNFGKFEHLNTSTPNVAKKHGLCCLSRPSVFLYCFRKKQKFGLSRIGLSRIGLSRTWP